MKKGLNVFLVVGLFLICSFGCSSKTTPTSGITKEMEAQILEQIVRDVDTENDDNIPNYDDDLEKYGPDSAKSVMMYSLYIEYFRQDNYVDAIKYWRYLFNKAPKFNKGIYVNGAKMYITFAEEEKAKEIKDENKIKALVDTLMMVYDQRIEYFNQEGFVMAEKGKNLFLLNPAGFIDAYKYLGRAMELDGNSVLTTTPYYYMYTASLMFKNKKIDIDQLLKGFESSMSICEYNIAQGDKVDKWKKIIDNILQLIGPLLPEDTLLPFLDKKYDVVKDNLENINLYLKIMSMNRFIDNPVFMKYSERAHKLNPSALSAYNLGNAWYGNEDYSKSVDYYKQATELLTDEDDNLTKAQYHMSLAEAYRKSNNYPAARASAQKAAAANPDDGTPYMFIGGLYASSAKSCGEGNSFKQNAVYWIAVDMYKIAQSKGVADAGTQVVKLRKFFPTKEEAFYVDPPVKDGDDYKIDCWINGSTKARFFE